MDTYNELRSYDYYLDKSNTWFIGHDDISDNGSVSARSEKEAIEKAKEALLIKFSKMNKVLKPLGVEIKLDQNPTIVVSIED